VKLNKRRASEKNTARELAVFFEKVMIVWIFVIGLSDLY
jgi:hypothetical protein